MQDEEMGANAAHIAIQHLRDLGEDITFDNVLLYTNKFLQKPTYTSPQNYERGIYEKVKEYTKEDYTPVGMGYEAFTQEEQLEPRAD